MRPYLVPALAVFRDEINARFPRRDKRSDGWIGDDSHATRNSQHNPDDETGAVRAIDIDVDDNDPNKDLRLQVIAAAKRDPRVWYIISNGIIWSRTYNWVAKKYYGNPHTGHVHVSVVEDPRAWRDTSPWFKFDTWSWNPKVVSDLAPIQRQFQIKQGMRKGTLKRYHGIAAIQNALNVKFLPPGKKLEVDGWVGAATLQAWRDFERSHKGTDSAGTPDPTSLRELEILYRFKGPETT